MKPAHERSQECLPPKKRELAQNSVSMEEQSRIESAPANDIPVSETPSWSNGVLLAAGQGVRYEVSGNGTETVTVDQYGNLYKVAVPSATYSPTSVHSVVNMTSIPPSFSVASPLIQHSGVTYPPNYYPISHTPVQLIGSPYTVPYAVSPGFLPRAVLSSAATFSASQVSHYVPYNSILTEGVTPPPQDSASQSFSKVPTAQSPPVLMGVLPLDVTKGRVPVFFQHSTQLPAVYPVHEMLMTCPPDMDVRSTSNNDKDSEITITSTNMCQRPSGYASDQKSNQAMSAYIHDTEGQIVRGTGETLLECDVYSVPGQRSNTSLIRHRSSPDTDLEVQSVVGGLASQDFSAAFIQKKDMQNPLKLSHDSNEVLGQPRGVFVQENVVGSILERTRKPSNNFSDQHIVKYTDKTPVIANGEAMEAGIYAEQSRFLEHASKTQRSKSPHHKIDTCSETAPPQAGARPTHSTSLPSHFMKGAIIQLATGELKRVEDLQTQDFVRSAEVSGGLKIDSSTVVDIQESQWPGFVTLHFVVGEQQSKVCLDVPPEHPFFVYGQGWSSCSPRQTAQLFALPCHRLQVGDVCISVSLQNISKSDVSTESCPVTTPILPQRTGKAAFLSHELSFLAAQDDEKLNQQKTDGTTSHSRTLCSLPTVQSNYSSPRVQKYSLQGTDAWPFPVRHSFIPQEVKLSIEGRSNAGK